MDDDKRVEAVGVDWVVVRNLEDGHPEFACGRCIHSVLLRHTRRDKQETAD